MAHIHEVIDMDKHFVIDPVTRIITNATPEKKMIMQYDHNSERYTFELPHYIDGHDMSLCNVVQVHYIDISPDKRTQKTGVYEVDDLQLASSDEGTDDIVLCSWLVSQNATQIYGSLNFLVRYSCTTDGTVDYAWNTAIFSGITVSNGIYNGPAVAEEYADILEQWRQELFSGGGGGSVTVDSALSTTSKNPVQNKAITAELEKKGEVKTVNGNAPDAAGNVAISVGSGEGTGTPGEDGGYYTPAVSDAGDLSWTPSKTNMPVVPAANIKGLKGDPGDNGITPEFSIGTVTTLDAGENATASITGTAEKPLLNLGVPRGLAGESIGVSTDGFVNALNYGLVGDGITDNLALFNQMITQNPGKTIYFGKGTFCFGGMLEIEKAYIILDNAELKLTADTTQTYFIKVVGYQPEGTEFPQNDMFIRGNGTINANLKAQTVVGIGTQKTMSVHGVKITGFTKYGIYNGIPEKTGYCYELIADNLLIWNDEILDGTVGILSGADSTFRDIVTLNAQTAIKADGGGNLFSNIHSWNFDFTYTNKQSIEGTCFAEITGVNNRFSDCYIDTCQYGYKLSGNCDHVMISNLFWWINSETWPTGVTPVVFVPNPDIASKFYVTNARLPGSQGAKFSEEVMDPSTFYNVYSNMINAVNNVGGESGGGLTNPLTEELDFNGYFAANIGGFSFSRVKNRNAYLGQVERDNSLALRVQLWDQNINSDIPLILTGIATPTQDDDAANKSYVDEKTMKRQEMSSTDTTAQLQPGKLYVFPEMASLSLTFVAPTDTSIANEYHCIFTSGATATELILPDNIEVGSLTIDANKVYELSMLENCLTWQSWEVTA